MNNKFETDDVITVTLLSEVTVPEEGEEEIGEVCISPQTYKHFREFEYDDLIELFVLFIKTSWEIYTRTFGFLSKNNDTVKDFIKWHNMQFSTFKIGESYRIEISNQGNNNE